MDSTYDFPFVAELPRREKSQLAKLWDRLREVHVLSKEQGQHWPVMIAAEALGISRQRVHQLIDDGRFDVVVVRGRKFISMVSIQAYAEAERKNGVALGEGRASWRRCVELAREELQK